MEDDGSVRLPAVSIFPVLDPSQVRSDAVDIRLGTDFVRVEDGEVTQVRVEMIGGHLRLLPGQFLIARSLEEVEVHRGDVYVKGRSAWARLGLMIATAVTLREGFRGHVSLELANQGDAPIVLHVGLRIATLLTGGALQGDKDAPRRYQDVLRPEFSALRERLAATPALPPSSDALTDVFVCHASEDKDEVARPLAHGLRSRGLKVWYDEFTVRLGDSLQTKIDEGLASARRGVVILSPAFFKKSWTRKELDGLIAKEVASGQSVIIPVWHNVTFAEVVSLSPTLAGRAAAKTGGGMEALISEIADELRHSAARPDADLDIGQSES